MRSKWRSPAFSVVLATLAASTAAAASQAAPIQPDPQRHWIVDEVGERCAMSRALSGPFPAVLTLQTYPGSQTYDLVLESSAWPGQRRLEQTTSRLQLKPGSESHWYLTQIEDARFGKGVALKMVELPGSFLLDFSKATGLVLSNWQLTAQTFTIPPGAGKAAEALVDCQVGRMIEWGADPAGFGIGASPVRPLGNAREWLGVDLFREMKSHRVAIRMLIAPNGGVEQCQFLQSNLGAAREQLACQSVLKKARFKPAKGPKGASVRSVFVLYFNLEKYDRWEYLPAD